MRYAEPLWAGAAALTVLAAGSSTKASTASTATVDGVTFPTGIVSGGNALEVGNLDQTGISAPGQQLQGVGQVEAITNTSGLNTAWTSGQNGVELVFEYSGYTSDVVTPPTARTPGSISYTGGQIGYYLLPAGTSISTGSIGGDIAAVEAGSLFLAETASVENGSGDTLVETIPANELLESYSAASAFGFLDVTGGAASSYFDTNTFTDAYDTGNGGLADVSLTEDLSTGAASDGFSDAGSFTAATNAAAVPEPSVAGICIAGAAASVARRRRSVTAAT